MLKFFRYSVCVLAFFSMYVVNAQETAKKNISPEHLTGKWQWVNDQDSFIIEIAFIDTSFSSKMSNNFFGPQITGWHRYVENGTLIESSFPGSSTNPVYKQGIFGVVMNNTNILLWFHDLTRERDFRIETEFLDSTGTLIKWITHRPQQRDWYQSDEPKIWEGQTIPRSLILHKIATLETTTASNKQKEKN